MGGLINKAQVETALVEELMLGGDQAPDEVHHVGLLDLDLGGAVLQARELEHGVNEAGEAPDLGGHDLQVLVVRGKDAVLHGLDRGLHCHERRAQLMGDIAGEAMLELDVTLDGRGHVIKGLAELTDLVGARDAGARREVAVSDLLCRRGDALDGLRHPARDKVPDHAGKKGRDGGRRRDGAVRVGAEGRVALGEQGLGPKGPEADLADDRAVPVKNLRGDERLLGGRDRGGNGLRPRGERGRARPGVVVEHVAVGVDNLHDDVRGKRGGPLGGGRGGLVELAGLLVCLGYACRRGVSDALHVLAGVGHELALPHHGEHHHKHQGRHYRRQREAEGKTCGVGAPALGRGLDRVPRATRGRGPLGAALVRLCVPSGDEARGHSDAYRPPASAAFSGASKR